MGAGDAAEWVAATSGNEGHNVNVRFENKAPTKVNPVAAVLCWLAVALEGFDLVALGPPSCRPSTSAWTAPP